MADITIRTLRDGPYEVRGTPKVVDSSRTEFKLDGDPVYLCRCGASKNRPFCDGTHKTIGFKSEEPAR